MQQLKSIQELEISRYGNEQLFLYTNFGSNNIEYDYEEIENVSRFYSFDSIKVKLVGYKDVFVVHIKDIYKN